MKDKPIQLRIENVKREIIDFINNIVQENELDYYFLSFIIENIYSEVKNGKETELQILSQQEEMKKEVDENESK